MLFWQWIALGVVLLIVEMLAPGFELLWIGGAAILAGIVVVFMPGLDPVAQWSLFSVAAVVLVVLSRRYFRKKGLNTPTSMNKRADQLIGRRAVLETDIKQGKGRAILGDTTWSVMCADDMPAGTEVVVVDREGTVLKVTRFSAP